MEALGNGITSIFGECEADMPKPDFRVAPHFVTLIVRFKNSLSPSKVYGTINGTLNADEMAIVKFIETHQAYWLAIL